MSKFTSCDSGKERGSMVGDIERTVESVVAFAASPVGGVAADLPAVGGVANVARNE